MIGWRKTIDILGLRFGLEHSLVVTGGWQPYLERWVLYWGGGTLRLHRFWRGDQDRHLHDHPWWFVTLPFADYMEVTHEHGRDILNHVRAFRFHFRPATYRHRILPIDRPIWTLVLTGRKTNGWGFWTEDGFVPWRQYCNETSSAT